MEPPTYIHHLYCSHNGWLRSWLYSKLGCTHRAADFTHDTFIRLLTKDELPNLNEPRAYLTTVARRILSNHWRRERLEKSYLEVLANQPEKYATSPEEQALLMEALVEIDRMLDGLPVVVRRAFIYARLDGMAYADIASTLDISVSTVKRYLLRAALQCYFSLGNVDPANTDGCQLEEKVQ